MKRFKRLLFSAMLITLLGLGSGCQMIPQGVQNLFASKTPTPTKTATATPTPTVTPTPTKTPLPPLRLYSCVFIENCPEAVTVYELANNEINVNGLNTIEVPINQPVQLLQDWTTVNQMLLDYSLPNIQWVFTIDGQDYFNPAWLEDGVIAYDDDPGTDYPGKWFGVVMNDWKLGESHTVKIGIIIDKRSDDGWGVYEAGTHFVTTYTFIPVLPPTATATATPTRTNTPKPTPVPYTKTPKATNTPIVPTSPPCSIDSSIEVDNTTGGIVSIDLKGPMKFHFDLATGHTSMKVCAGSYSYKAWGCGGASDSGTLSSGEAHEFYCQ